ncbi:MAG: CDP-alcohol phosphatidyltransferase family protein [Oscillospiraceae bacterium]|nr:CDP-alcohol phosphatidyltransferase family protein [Oscillospiraceae bacterium]
MGIPNILSVCRILLIPVFLWVYLTAGTPGGFLLAAGILLISGLTDLLDGWIARRFHMVTALGRVLDPVADKLTQAAVCTGLAIRYPQLTFLLVIFILKELLMLIGGFKLLRKNRDIAGARWFGKLYTFVFYVITLFVVGHQGLSEQTVMILLLITAGFMVFSFAMYIPMFLRLNKKGTASEDESAPADPAQK